MRTKTSQASEDYLKTIYALTRESERASTNQIAGEMGVTPASATGMIQKLASAQPPLLVYEKHRGAALTAEGELVALEIIRHHRLLETFLHDKLGYSWDEVHEEADRLEHFISEELEERIAQALDNPSSDPHGDPIPSREFEMPDQVQTCLADLRAGDQAVVRRIDSADAGLLRYLASVGLLIHSQLTVTDVFPYDGNIRLRITGQDTTHILGNRITSRIWVARQNVDAALRQEAI
jgi:DtxR family Mn-dependent transcriptional regulator